MAEQEQADHENSIRKLAGDNLPTTLFLLEFSLSCYEQQPRSETAGKGFCAVCAELQGNMPYMLVYCKHLPGCWCVLPASDDNWRENVKIAVKLAAPQP